jgi:hypothetical protein
MGKPVSSKFMQAQATRQEGMGSGTAYTLRPKAAAGIDPRGPASVCEYAPQKDRWRHFGGSPTVALPL